MVGQNIGKYRVLDRVGRGGMGTVYRALDETLHREVAIKILNAELNDPEVARRFRAEAVTVARLNHPGIATIYELFQHDGQWLMVMEFVRGETLERMVERLGPLSPQRAADLAMQSLTALAHAHSMGVVHRDLKPANLMITESGSVKIMDFGIARVAGAEHLTSAGFMMGTPAYMAPEQVMGQEIDTRTDLYALGVVFYYLVSAKLPFKGDTPMAMAQSRINDQPTPVLTARQGLPNWIGQVIQRALAKKPENRFQSADQFREALRRGLAGLPLDVVSNSVPPEMVATTPPRAMPITTGMPSSAAAGFSAETIAAPSPTAASRAAAAAAGAPTSLGPPSAQPTTPVSTGTLPPGGLSGGATDVAPIVVPMAATLPPAGKPAPASNSRTLMAIGSAVVLLLVVGGGAMVVRSRRATAAAEAAAAAAAAATPPPAPVVDLAPVTTPPPPDASTPTPGTVPPGGIAPGTPGAGAATANGKPPATSPSPGTTGSPTTAGGTGSPSTPSTAANGAKPPSTTPGTPGTPTAAGGTGTPVGGTTAPGRSATGPTTAGRGGPVDTSHVTFPDVRHLVINGAKSSDEDVVLNFVGGQISLTPKKGGEQIQAVAARQLAKATYVHAKDLKYDTTLPGPPDPLELPSGVFGRGARHWLVLQWKAGYMVLSLSDSNWQQIIAAIEAHSPVKVDRPAPVK